MAATIMASGVYVTKGPSANGAATPVPAGCPIAISGRYSPQTPSAPPAIISQTHVGLKPVALAAPATTANISLQAEIARRQAAEARVRELEGLVAQLQHRVAILESGNGRPPRKAVEGRSASAGPRVSKVVTPSTGASAPAAKSTSIDTAAKPAEDPIDRAICEYLERNPDFPVSIQKVAHNYYVFGDRGTVFATQRGDHIVVRVGGGYKSLQVFMDERALMVTREAAGALSEKGHSS